MKPQKLNFEGDFLFINGDSRKELIQIPDKSVQCIITSPPYWGLRDYNSKDQIGIEDDLCSYLDNINLVVDQLFRVLKDDGVLWLNIGDGYTSGNRKYRARDNKNPKRAMDKRPDNPIGLKNKNLLGIPWRIAFNLQEYGWYLRADVIWHKPNAMPESVRDRPYRNHEYLFLFSKSEHYFFDNKKLKDSNGKTIRTVWSILNNSKSTIHSAVFPESLVELCLLAASKKDDIILDPFCGIGTVGKVCTKHNRRFIGIETNNEFIIEAKKNITN